MTTTSSPDLNQAIALARTGQKAQAVSLIRHLLQQDPNNVLALLWLGGLATSPEEGIAALERALQLDPDNQAAQRGLAHRLAHRHGQSEDSAGGRPGPPPPLPVSPTPYGANLAGETPASGDKVTAVATVSSQVEPQVPSESSSLLDVPQPDLVPEEGLCVIQGSAYLHKQEQHAERKRASMARIGLILSLLAMLSGTYAILFLVVGLSIWATCILVAGVGVGGLAVLLVPAMVSLNAEHYSFASGRAGEEAAVALFKSHLDGHWTLFRNLILPDGYGDIDAVLAGPRGIYALEVKTYRGYYRNLGHLWHWRNRGRWHIVHRNPTRQAKRNAKRLSNYLRQHGLQVWVEPRVVWAGDGKLWLDRPAIPVWQLANPNYVMQDIQSGKILRSDVLSRVNAVLRDLHPELTGYRHPQTGGWRAIDELRGR